MSSFIASPKHFNSVEKALQGLTEKQDFYFPYSLKTLYPELTERNKYGLDNKYECITSIIDELRRLTCICVSLQYAHHYQGTLDKEIQDQTFILFSDKKSFESLNTIELYKALQCLVYQIEPEHLKELRNLSDVENNALFFCKEMLNRLACHIVESDEDYEKSGWSID